MQKMEEVYCEERRNDEIGELARDVNELYMNLKITIEKLESEKELISKLEREKVDLVRSASHELKTPLSSLHIMLENMLIGTVKPKNYKEKIEDSLLIVEKMSKMIQDILNADIVKREGKDKEIDVKKVILEELKEYELIAKTRNLQFEKRITDFKIKTNYAAMREVLSNLISNAVKYAEVGSIIVVKCERGKFSIWNQGERIAEDQILDLFNPFYRMDGEGEGSGMGLYFVKNILTGLGFKFRLAAYKNGMRFEIWFK